jgi:hypothetical protein
MSKILWWIVECSSAKHTNNSPLQGSLLLASLFLRNAHAVWGNEADGVFMPPEIATTNQRRGRYER